MHGLGSECHRASVPRMSFEVCVISEMCCGSAVPSHSNKVMVQHIALLRSNYPHTFLLSVVCMLFDALAVFVWIDESNILVIETELRVTVVQVCERYCLS